jgi:hypothetical protein
MMRGSALAIRFAVALALATLAGGVLVPIIATVGAEAPGLATVLYDAPLLEGPNASANVIKTVREGTDVEITGHNAIGYLQVIANGDAGWMSTDALTISGVNPVQTASTPGGTAILDAPLPDANVLGEVPAEGVVILTGAHVDVYVAGSYDGVGGWILESDLDMPYDADGRVR